ncbi:hypothetical protein CFR78_04295 [Komagataeibacter rhaeticus]|uniref:DUF3486 family protein n=1 Tax=Komagataeibacter rhaeticus TaxID=215221 RepID=UPI0004D73AB9|nr:DUF3486 family protein [Komagataeibacter rhaeticus]KDU96470.1 hypothetical protein GLUCORHAEAF1_01765 [Komagataeibacter rhaeticus AF1]PYD54195.1 hypothetical protein CFR78_04295 [Komagataeibacter rhaeticus]GBQ15209.1 Mu-like prophage FluMu protein GP27 [Komagataeibacter rhaeticus DSM 16663]
MARPSSIERLPPEIREVINRLLDNHCTFDQIVAKLRELDVTHISRSTVGRYAKGHRELGERLRRSRMLSEVLVREQGDAPPSRTAQLNLELMHTVIFDLFTALEDGSDAAIEKLKSDPKAIEQLSKALDHLSRSAKTDADYRQKLAEQVEARLRRQVEQTVTANAKRQGLSAESVAAMLDGAFGVKK